jgi:hypothetical protein
MFKKKNDINVINLFFLNSFLKLKAKKFIFRNTKGSDRLNAFPKKLI